MGDGVQIKIRRKDALFWKLRKMSPTLDKNLSKAILKGAEDIQSLAKFFVSVDKGDLMLSMEIKPIRGKMGVTFSVGGKTAFYARWVEFGTAPHMQGGKFAGTRHPGTDPQPFFYPAYRIQKPRIQRRITRAINKSAKEVSKAK